jgi:hypothetical protein
MIFMDFDTVVGVQRATRAAPHSVDRYGSSAIRSRSVPERFACPIWRGRSAMMPLLSALRLRGFVGCLHF